MSLLTWSILLSVSWLAATISGVAGFGGSLIILPVFSYIVWAKQAVPIFTIAWMMGNISKAVIGFSDIRWRPVNYFCLGALPGALIGARIFVDIPAAAVMKMIGVFLLGIVLLRQRKDLPTVPVSWFVPTGFIVGVCSSLFGSAGPLGAAAFLGLNLPATAYVASEAVTAVVMHAAKTALWGQYRLISPADLMTGVILGLAMIVGSATGRLLIQRLDQKTFRVAVDVLMTIAAVSLLL